MGPYLLKYVLFNQYKMLQNAMKHKFRCMGREASSASLLTEQRGFKKVSLKIDA